LLKTFAYSIADEFLFVKRSYLRESVISGGEKTQGLCRLVAGRPRGEGKDWREAAKGL
jgi:hypothetical protein